MLLFIHRNIGKQADAWIHQHRDPGGPGPIQCRPAANMIQIPQGSHLEPRPTPKEMRQQHHHIRCNPSDSLFSSQIL